MKNRKQFEYFFFTVANENDKNAKIDDTICSISSRGVWLTEKSSQTIDQKLLTFGIELITGERCALLICSHDSIIISITESVY